MNKAELIERTIDALIDPWNDDPNDYLHVDPIDLCQAENILRDVREGEDSAELEPEERLPEAVTPSIMMEAFNCLIRARKFTARVNRLADWLTANECVCEYDQFKDDYLDNPLTVLPTEFLNEDDFPFPIDNGHKPSPLRLIDLGNRSSDFDQDDEFCWYDKERDELVSSDTPFDDGIIDAEALATFILLNADAFGYIFDDIIDEDEAQYILGCTKEEYANE